MKHKKEWIITLILALGAMISGFVIARSFLLPEADGLQSCESEFEVRHGAEFQCTIGGQIMSCNDVKICRPYECDGSIRTVETVSPVSYAAIGIGVILVVISGVLFARRKQV